MKSFMFIAFSIFMFSFIGCGERPSKENFHEITSSTIKAVITEMEDLGEEFSYYKVQLIGSENAYFLVMKTNSSFCLGATVRLYVVGRWGFLYERYYIITPDK